MWDMSHSKFKLLSLVVLLFSAVSLCLAETAADATTRVNGYSSDVVRSLTKRIDPRITQWVQELQASVRVNAGQTSFMSFDNAGPHSFASDGFNGCTGIVIASERGAIIGHYFSNPNGVNTAKSQLPPLIQANSGALNPGGQAYVYAQVDYENQSQFDAPDVKNQLVQLLQANGFNPIITTYIEPLANFVDADGDVIDDIDMDNAQYGSLIVSNAGGGTSPTDVRFISIAVQEDLLRSSPSA